MPTLRERFRYHFSSVLCMFIMASIMLGLNLSGIIKPRPFDGIAYGFPKTVYIALDHPTQKGFYSSQWEGLEDRKLKVDVLILDIVFGLIMVGIAGEVSERIIRRRKAQKQAGLSRLT